MRVLAGDIGDTNARLAIVELGDGRPEIRRASTFKSEQFDDLLTLVRRSIGYSPTRPERASLAVACPIVDGICRPPNLAWEIDVGRLGAQIGIEDARVLNDFEAVGHAIAHLGPDAVVTIRTGDPVALGPIAVTGAGTGLGAAVLVHDGARYRVVSSEGGHVDWGPRGELQVALLRFLSERHREESGGHVSYERVLSGEGFAAVYEFLVETHRAQENPETRRAMAKGEPAAVISRRGARGKDPGAAAALNLFVEMYGAAAGNLALLVQARGGVYLAGGIACRNLRHTLWEGHIISQVKRFATRCWMSLSRYPSSLHESSMISQRIRLPGW